MSRIPTPETIDAAPAASQPHLEGVKKMLGSAPNMFRLISNSPAALQGYLGLNTALGGGALDAPTRERIALAVAEANGCGYCLAAHTYLGSNLAKLSDEEIMANRKGGSMDAKADAAVKFAGALVEKHGRVSDADIMAVRDAGYSDEELVEIVAHVAVNTLTNYMNEAFGTEIDFPQTKAIAA